MFLSQKVSKKFSDLYGVKYKKIDQINSYDYKDVDGIIICTPTSTHLNYIKIFAPLVKNIFVEKPIANTLEETYEVQKIINKYKNNLQVGFIERFNPAVRSLKSILKKNKKVINIDFTRTNKVSSRINDSDVVSDLMIHDLDLAIYINGPVKNVYAQGYAKENMIDFASAILKHKDGAQSRVLASRITNKKLRLIEVTCEDKFIDCDLLKKEMLIHRQAPLKVDKNQNYIINEVNEIVNLQSQEALLIELLSFVASCNGKKSEEFASINEGLEAIKICSKVRDSIKLNEFQNF